jgi:hypothetical protein
VSLEAKVVMRYYFLVVSAPAGARTLPYCSGARHARIAAGTAGRRRIFAPASSRVPAFGIPVTAPQTLEAACGTTDERSR